jgi:opacity protein-like surface antigen
MKTKTWLKSVMTVAVAVQAGVAWAEDSPWTLRLGASYRDFDDMEFKRGDFRNWGQSDVAPFGVQNVTTVVGNPLNAPVILDYVRADGGSDGLDSSDKWAPIIGIEYDLTPQCDLFGLSLVGNFQYYRFDARSSGAGAVGAPGPFTVQQYQHWWVDTDAPPDTIPDTLTPGVLLLGPSLPGTTFAVRSTFDMQLYVLDFGLQARVKGGPAKLTLALGPTLTIADADSKQSQQASWLAQGPGLPAGTYARKASDSEVDFLPGAYAALGVSVDVSTSWSIGVECRYDYVDGDAGTDQVKMDLSSFSGVVRLAYQF